MSASNRLGFWLVRNVPIVFKLLLNPIVKSSLKDPEKQLDKFMSAFSEPDQHIVKEPNVRKVLIEDMQEAYRQGVIGHLEDAKYLVKPWGFDLEDIDADVHIWHGEKDRNVPLSMGQYFEKAISKSKAYYYPEEGHLLYLKYWKEILSQLKA